MTCLLILFVVLARVFGQQQLLDNSISQECMGCICEAASKCDVNAGCTNGMCGLFKITFPYWVDAGKPIILGDDPNDSKGRVKIQAAIEQFFQN